jgi:hypothetical protein
LKKPFLFFIYLLFYLVLFFGLAFPFGGWLVLGKEEMTLLELISSARLGALWGGGCAIVLWFMYRFNLHK